MTDREKRAIVDDLIANACCWKKEDREELMSLTDNQLMKLKESSEKAKQEEAVANAARKGFQDPLGNTHVWNEKDKKWAFQKKEKGEGEDDEEDEDEKLKKNKKKPVANTAAPITEAEYLAAAPESVREDLAFARQIKQEQKGAAIKVITANARNKFTAEQLDALPLNVLQNLAELAQGPEKKPNPLVANYVGSGATFNRSKANMPAFGLPSEYLPAEKANGSK